MRKLQAFCRRYRELGVYLLLGILTTAVNYLVYLSLLNNTNLSGALSNMLAWFAAVVFAFLTNKPFVFHSCDWRCKTVIPELLRFFGCRFLSGMTETGLILISVDILQWNGNIMKAATSGLVVIMNYIIGKRIAFQQK